MPFQALARPASRAQRAAETAARLTDVLAVCAAKLGAPMLSAPQSPLTRDVVAKIRGQIDGQVERERQLQALADKVTILLKVASRLPLATGARDRIHETLDRLGRAAGANVINLARVRRRRVASRSGVEDCVADVNAACEEVEASNARLRSSLDEIRRAIANGLSASRAR
jgi:hypothetical protein